MEVPAMWNVFKFFFVWFWLGVATFLVVPMIAPKTEARVEMVRGRRVTVSPEQGNAVVAFALGFLMCIPAYFIARPKRQTQGDSYYRT
jgi:hypothetical protein